MGYVLLDQKFAKDAKVARLYTRMDRKTAMGRVAEWKFSKKSLDGAEDEGSFRQARCATSHDDFEGSGSVSDSTVGLMREFFKAAAPAGEPPG